MKKSDERIKTSNNRIEQPFDRNKNECEGLIGNAIEPQEETGQVNAQNGIKEYHR